MLNIFSVGTCFKSVWYGLFVNGMNAGLAEPSLPAVLAVTAPKRALLSVQCFVCTLSSVCPVAAQLTANAE